MTDVIIIGKGPAGISASLYTIRGNLSTRVIGKDYGSLYKADKIENYYGFPEPISGKDLLDNGIQQAKRLGVEFEEDEIVGITFDGSYNVIGKNKTYQAKAVVLAVGQPGKKPSVKGLKNFEGKGVSYCTTCDGFFYKNKKVGVLGYTDYAVHEAQELLTYTKDITLFTNGNELEVDEKLNSLVDQFKVVTEPISGISGSEFVEKIEFDDSSAVEIDGLFVAYGSASAVEFALKMGVMTKNNALVVDDECFTGIPGLYACGDCTGGFKQISVAVGQGAIAGKNVLTYVKGLYKK